MKKETQETPEKWDEVRRRIKRRAIAPSHVPFVERSLFVGLSPLCPNGIFFLLVITPVWSEVMCGRVGGFLRLMQIPRGKCSRFYHILISYFILYFFISLSYSFTWLLIYLSLSKCIPEKIYIHLFRNSLCGFRLMKQVCVTFFLSWLIFLWIWTEKRR